jgi:drug/metabolite transporter (DMT)-like permease
MLPPFLLAGCRFTLAGGVLLLWLHWHGGGARFSPRELWEAALTGAAIIFVTNGTVAWATVRLSPGVVAVLAATMPIWTALGSLPTSRGRTVLPTFMGVGVSFGGVWFLTSPSGVGIQPGPLVVTVASVLVGSMGVLLSARTEVARRPLALATVQMLVGGGLLLLLSTATGEPAHARAVSMAVMPILGYLVLTAALGYFATTWLLVRVSPVLSTSQLNAVPVITLLLGWLLLGEQIGWRTVFAAALILSGVTLVAIGRLRDQGRMVDPHPGAPGLPLTEHQ